MMKFNATIVLGLASSFHMKPISAEQLPMTATTTRYWDCSGGSCGCAYLPYGDPATPAHCHSNAMFEAPANNPYDAKFYGTAAVSNVLFQDTNGNGWLGEGCGKCYKVTGMSNIAGYSGVKTTLVLKAANYCPPENPMCSGDKAHFDIAAPGFDVTKYSFSHTCPEREPEEAEGFAACGTWMIDDQNPDINCDCSKFISPVLRAGCNSFYSLKWDNAAVEYEEVECPFQLNRLNCWEENGFNYPFDIPQFCASNIEDEPSPPPNPTDQPTAKTSNKPTLVSNEPSLPPTSCVDDPSELFFLRMKDSGPIFKDCEWLAGKTDERRMRICKNKTDSYGDIGPAEEVCQDACEMCHQTGEPTESPTIRRTEPPTAKEPTTSPPSALPTSRSPAAATTCCSHDLKTCADVVDWCQENCDQCGGIYITGAPLQCIARWGECTNDINGCCSPATCNGDQWYSQCLI